MYDCMYVCVFLCLFVCILVYECMYMCVRMYVCMYVCARMLPSYLRWMFVFGELGEGKVKTDIQLVESYCRMQFACGIYCSC